MTTPLADRLRDNGRTTSTVAEWIRERLDDEWHTVWDDQLPKLTKAWEEIGEPAYGIYNRELYRTIQRALKKEGLNCRPQLPGSLDLSEEHWGPEDHRERRMWTLLVDDGKPVGALVTRFYHDHTELRLPDKPTIVAVDETDHDVIRDIVCGDPVEWAAEPA